MSRPQLLKFVDGREVSRDSRDTLGRPNRSGESPNNINISNGTITGTPVNSQKRDNPHKNI